MKIRATLLLLGVCLTLGAQMKWTVDQLVSVVKSSLELKYEDRKLAEYLRKVKLVQRLDDRTIEDLQGLGAGPKTTAALRELRDASRSLPSPTPPPPKPVVTPIPGPSQAEQRKILDEARDYALNYTKHLPDFICTQVTRRYFDPTGLEIWRSEDTVVAKLTYFEQKEDYKVILVNDKASDMKYDQLGGASSRGEFGSMLRWIFEPESHARFQWDRWATLRSKRMHVFSYRVAQPNSKWHVIWERTQDIVPGYHGQIFVDRDNQMVMRVTLEAEDIPPSFPIQDARTLLDYDYVTISDHEYVVPLRAVIRMRHGKELSKNEVEFRLYRKFGAEATITFETPPPLPEDKTKEQPPKQ